MFKVVHLISAVCRIVLDVCRSICNIFMCPEHSKKGENDE